MPIQPMNVTKYNPVPEVEDVTPLDKSIAKKEQKSFKAVAVAFGSIVILSGLAFFGWRFSSALRGTVYVFQTSQDTGDRLAPLDLNGFSTRGFNLNSLSFGNTHDRVTSAKMRIDASKLYQEIIGFGGAFTEAAAYNFFKLPEKVRQKVIKLYFGDDGIGYTLGRVHINSCDFSLQSYSFDEIDGDYALQYFDTEVTHDNAQMIPMIRQAMDAAKVYGQSRAMKAVPNGVNLLASPWSPPVWMKVGKDSMTGSNVPNGLIDDHKVKSAWALYFAKWIEAYSYKGVPIWAVTPQNEPEFPVSEFSISAASHK
jgi:O-glycosyl hydrolase